MLSKKLFSFKYLMPIIVILAMLLQAGSVLAQVPSSAENAAVAALQQDGGDEPDAMPTATPVPEDPDGGEGDPPGDGVPGEQEPSEEQTEELTEEPTDEPIVEPSEEPTAEPTEEPTAEPSEEPTAEPSEEPTAEPSEVPGKEATREPDAGNEYFSVEKVTLKNGTELEKFVISGPPVPPKGFQRPSVDLQFEGGRSVYQKGATLSLLVPAFSWSFGCSATSAAMIAGFYDRNGYPDMYTGPTNGGIMPLNNSAWGYWTDSHGDSRAQCPLSATRQGLDGRATKGHVDDYWKWYGQGGHDPWYGNWTEHTIGDSTGDYMRTNQWEHGYENTDGSTTFWSYNSGAKLNCSTMESQGIKKDGTVGFRNFIQSRGYTVDQCYSQKTNNKFSSGFSFSDYMSEINAGYPVMIHVTGHTMVGVGYNSASNQVILNDTWDYETHTMTWGGSYVGMEMYAVSIVHPAGFPDPGQVVLSSPANKGYSNQSPTGFAWNSDATSSSYHLQISDSKGFKTILFEQDNIGGTSVNVLLDDANYYWRVRGKNDSGAYGKWSATWYFTQDTIPPDEPTLKKPTDGSETVGIPTFQWNKASGAAGYQWGFNTSYDPNNSIYYSQLTAKTSYSPPSMDPMINFYWYVRAVDKAGNFSDWSDPFTIKVLPPTPGAPTLLTPARRSATNDNTPEFMWLEVNFDGGGYQIMVDDDRKFGSPAIDETTAEGETSYTPSSGLPDGKYYWQVRAQNMNGSWGKWSKMVDFTVDTTPPASPLLSSPSSGSSIVGTPTFKWKKVSDAVTYQFEYNDVDDPDEYIHRSGEIAKKTLYAPPAMDVLTPFYWYVRAADAAGNWSEWSDPFTVTIVPPPPGAPTLLSPANKGMTDTNPPTFEWVEVNYDGGGYQIDIALDSKFSNIIHSGETGEGDVEYTPGSELSGGKLYWRVRALNANDDAGKWSKSSYFTLYPSFDTQFNSSGNFEGWVQHPGASWTVGSGYLSNNGLPNGVTSSASYNNSGFTDFTYEARIKLVGPSSSHSNHHGLVVRGTPTFSSANDWQNAYYFDIWQINDPGYGQLACINIVKITNGKWASLNPNGYWYCYDDITYGNFNVIKAVVTGTKLKFYINDSLLLSKSSSGPKSGRVGVYSYSGHSSAYTTQVDWAVAGMPSSSSDMDAVSVDISEATGFIQSEPGHNGTYQFFAAPPDAPR